MAEFLYEYIYCRYLAPGECMIHDDAGEFRSNVQQKLARDFGVDYRCIKGGRPQANGQAESAVKLVKNKIRMIGHDNGNYFLLFVCWKFIRKILIHF